ncbi:MAG: dihydropteroate synthase, partial [Chloroflexi bacterium]|nr:dihydropteroate synthase [Chloroflexota bacterium]
MGILNVTPDSFSGDGLLARPEDAPFLQRVVSKALQMIAEGADILDMGGESTRPGAAPVDAETEISRIVPAIRAIRAETDAPLSVDTYKASVARAALDAGADMVNDVWGLRMDPEMAPLVAERRVPIVIMHNRSKPHNAAQEARLGGRYIGVHYEDLLADILHELRGQITMALERGIAPEQILVDPGIGFGKTVEQNLS